MVAFAKGGLENEVKRYVGIWHTENNEHTTMTYLSNNSANDYDLSL